MATQTLLKYPPGLNINLSDSRIIELHGKENAYECSPDETRAVSRNGAADVQPRIRNLHLPLRPRKPYACVDGSALRKKLGHTAVMVAYARQRMNRRKAASQAAILARLFNFTGEWGCDAVL